MKDYQLAAILETVADVTEVVLCAWRNKTLIEAPIKNINETASYLRQRDDGEHPEC